MSIVTIFNALTVHYSTAEIIIATTSVAPGTAFSITDVGTGESGSPPLRCLTSSPSTAVWLFPSGSTVPLGSNPVAPHGTIISVRQSTSINLYRGDGAITPAGQYCCGSPTFASQRLCVTLSKSILGSVITMAIYN